MIARPEHSGDILEFPIREQVWIVGHVRADAHLRQILLLCDYYSSFFHLSKETALIHAKNPLWFATFYTCHMFCRWTKKKLSWWSLTIIFGSLWIVAWPERLEGKKAVSPVCARFGVIVLNYYIHAGARAISVSGNEKKESQLTVFGMCNYQGQMYYFVQL